MTEVIREAVKAYVPRGYHKKYKRVWNKKNQIKLLKREINLGRLQNFKTLQKTKQPTTN